MATFKIKLGDKAAFLNRMEKQGETISSEQIKDNKLEDYFEVDIVDPKQLEVAKTILKQSPKINTIKEMKKKLTKDQLKEMIRQELQGVLAEKKKMKGEDKLDEAGVGTLTDPNFIAGAATLLGVGGTLLITYINALRKAKTPEEKAKIKADLGKAIEKANLMV
jgi:hypothetical protein